MFVLFISMLIAAYVYLSGVFFLCFVGILPLFLFISIARGGSLLPGPLNVIEALLMMGAAQVVYLPVFLFNYLTRYYRFPAILIRDALLSLSTTSDQGEITLRLKSGSVYRITPTEENNRLYDMHQSGPKSDRCGTAKWGSWKIGSLLREIKDRKTAEFKIPE